MHAKHVSRGIDPARVNTRIGLYLKSRRREDQSHSANTVENCARQNKCMSNVYVQNQKRPPKVCLIIASYVLYGLNKTLESAAFPNGLPEALEASVALQLLSEGTSSDSDHGSGCSCHHGGDCDCAVLRKSASKRKKKEPSSSSDASGVTPPPNTLPGPSASHATLARVQELPPILPRPNPRRFDHEGPVHEPSSSSHHSHGPSRHHIHDSTLFSPYGRAYDHTHKAYVNTRAIGLPPIFPDNNIIPLSSSDIRPQVPQPPDQFMVESLVDWSTFQASGDIGRSILYTPNTRSGTCPTNSDCSGCIDCMPLGYPDPLPPNTAPSIPSGDAARPYPNRDNIVNDWARQMAFFQSQDTPSEIQPLLSSPYDGLPPDFNQLDMYFMQSGTAGINDFSRSNLTFATSEDRGSSVSSDGAERRTSPFEQSPTPDYASNALYDQHSGYISVPVTDEALSALEIGRSRSSSSSSSSASGSSRISMPQMSRLSMSSARSSFSNPAGERQQKF
ncbi:copper-binding transcription factor [Paramarasmius palmivorus]|uniref:Copper-binding transcription factor n=1 Tax=Paramarasmius palmivorus TaxID=297713 RepID=A0AAW0EC90_9AGAR